MALVHILNMMIDRDAPGLTSSSRPRERALASEHSVLTLVGADLPHLHAAAGGLHIQVIQSWLEFCIPEHSDGTDESSGSGIRI